LQRSERNLLAAKPPRAFRGTAGPACFVRKEEINRKEQVTGKKFEIQIVDFYFQSSLTL
jgi:hypothetical protein